MVMKKIFIVFIKERNFYNKKTSQVIGKDQIIKKKDGKSINFSLRFHLYPGLKL